MQKTFMQVYASLCTVRLVFLLLMKSYFIFIITAIDGTMTGYAHIKLFYNNLQAYFSPGVNSDRKRQNSLSVNI